ncbi:MAG TPA: hypothetical protein VK464_23570 [Symbiobacteriaceae bacterium]|jgi:hypothetical protein|nr:hypothetical protein [Symbiobacteriaceae bacterium]
MRQLLTIACLVALLMYAGFASLYGKRTEAVVPVIETSAAAGLQPLSSALEASGAKLEEAVIAARVEVAEPADREKVVAALGWSGKTPKDETRLAQVQARDGRHLLLVRWTLRGVAANNWEARAREVSEILAHYGSTPLLTVQLGGRRAPTDDLTQVPAKALDALRATSRQPWADGRAASLAGRTKMLPASPLGVNVQAAARKDQASGQVRVWVAWPALLQEY